MGRLNVLSNLLDKGGRSQRDKLDRYQSTELGGRKRIRPVKN